VVRGTKKLAVNPMTQKADLLLTGVFEAEGKEDENFLRKLRTTVDKQIGVMVGARRTLLARFHMTLSHGPGCIRTKWSRQDVHDIAAPPQ
jgi:hypothetical protein